MRIYYSDRHDLKLPSGHRFPGQKYGMLRRYLVAEGIILEDQLQQSPLIDDRDLFLAHDEDYVRAIEDGSIEASAMRRIGFPWTPQISVRARATVGGALAAARCALTDGISGQLAGGTHHAHRDFGSGYCVLNDFAVAALTLLEEQAVQSLAIIDLDVHQGDGNSSILSEDSRIFILSVHGEKNFPFRKVNSTLDVPLPDHIEDRHYLTALEDALEAIWRFQPELILYQAGVDPLASDRLGRMNLSFDGLMHRDRMVLEGARARNIPVSMGIGGGYADPIEDSVMAYANTYRVVREVYG